MAEVASGLSMGPWDRPYPWSGSPESSRCVPFESQAYQIGPHFNLASFWNSIAPKGRNGRGHKNSMPSISLSVQQTDVKLGKRRRPSASGAPDSSRLNTTPSSESRRANQRAADDQKSTKTRAATTSRDSLDRAGDTLFSSIGVEHGQPYQSGNKCDLCRQPFETEEALLLAHLSRHFHELEGSLSCQRCQISFSHQGDLEWHMHSTEHKNDLYRPISRSPLGQKSSSTEEDRFKFCVRLRKWEQAQLHFHSRTIDDLSKEKNDKPHTRSKSLPPTTRKPLDSLEWSIRPESFDDSPSLSTDEDETITIKAASWSTEQTLLSLQQRIRDLMEQVLPDPPEDQDTPYSEFCETHSLPGSPEQLSKDDTLARVNRAISEPPYRTCGTGDWANRTNPYGGPDTNTPSHAAWNAASYAVGQKRANIDRDSGGWNDDEEDENGGLQPRKRKKGPKTATEVEKRFPCIYHVGEPEQFKTDTTRYPHISNMSRHLKSHSFYACSTCMIRFGSNQELQAHTKVVGHVQACSDRGCRRTKPSNSYSNPNSCSHIRNAEDQWRHMFSLLYNRPPPDVFGGTSSIHLANGVASTQEASAPAYVPQLASNGSSNDCLVDYGLNDSFFDQAMDFDLGLPADGLVPATLNIEEFLVSDPTTDLQVVEGASAHAEAIVPGPPLAAKESEQSSSPRKDTVTSLQQQMAALERIVSTQRANEKDQIQSLQEKVFQLEQKLYQSSEREQKLEAALHVIFDAFRASGAPQAQPNKPYWKLFMTHTGQGVGPAPVSPAQSEGQQEAVPPSSFLSMSPSLTFAAKPAAQTPPDSTYGSTK